MFGSLGMPEILFILVLALLIFGPKRLPELGRTLGKGLREFRRATTDLKRTVESEMEAAEAAPARPVEAVKPAPEPVAATAAGAVPRATEATEAAVETPVDATAPAAADAAAAGSQAAE
jgi:sec-independent protein translocase protein TatA